MSLSKPKIDNFLRRKVSPRQGSLHYIPVLLSDSKGFAIKRRIGLNFVEFRCAAPAVDFLEKHLKTNQDKSFLIYIWIGTCDIFEKEGRFTRVRTWDNTVVDHIVSQYHRVITIVKQYPNTKVKFLKYPVFLYLLIINSKVTLPRIHFKYMIQNLYASGTPKFCYQRN